MLIDTFPATWLEHLQAAPSMHPVYLLIDGAFVPGLHKLLGENARSLLFESLPGCTAETKDVSPFVTLWDAGDKRLRNLLRRCDRWPMVSAIETPESLKDLSDRLAAWCIVEADGQRFNLRFPDTRRLPAIFRTLNPAQRAQMAGPAVRWSYVSRDGQWRELEVAGSAGEIASEPTLDQHQFGALVDDSRADELMTLLRRRRNDPYQHPSRSHALLDEALRAAASVKLDDGDTLDWCEWFWQADQLHDASTTAALLADWRAVVH